MATATATGLSPAGSGTHNVEASYPGDTSYQSSVSSTTALTAELITPTLTVTPLSASIPTTQALTVNVAVSGGSRQCRTDWLRYADQWKLHFHCGDTQQWPCRPQYPCGVVGSGCRYADSYLHAGLLSSSIYNAATGSSSVTVTVTTAAKVTPAVSVTPSASSITTAQALAVTVTVSRRKWQRHSDWFRYPDQRKLHLRSRGTQQ